MKQQITANICNNKFKLRSIIENDIEILRAWKNNHKQFFFYKNEITVEEQKAWFQALEKRPNDHMMIIQDDEKQIGCIGIRFLDGMADIYNVILGDKTYKGKHVMTNALYAVVSFSNLIYPNIPIIVKVLCDNPAINWYQKIGFQITETCEDYVVMNFYENKITNKLNFTINLTSN